MEETSGLFMEFNRLVLRSVAEGDQKNSRGGNGCTTSNGYVINDFSHELVSFAKFQFFLRCEFNVFPSDDFPGSAKPNMFLDK